MANYDAKILYEFADRLYRRANEIVALCVMIAGLVFGGIAYSIFNEDSTYALLGAALGGLLGYFYGQERAFLLKLQAQTALCQVQIEENTRNNGGTSRT